MKGRTFHRRDDPLLLAEKGSGREIVQKTKFLPLNPLKTLRAAIPRKSRFLAKVLKSFKPPILAHSALISMRSPLRRFAVTQNLGANLRNAVAAAWSGPLK